MQRRSKTAEFRCINGPTYIKYTSEHMRTHQFYFHSIIGSILGWMNINIWGVLNVYFGTSGFPQW